MSYYRPPMGDYKTYGYAGDPGWLTGLFAAGKKLLTGSIAHYKRKAARGLGSPIGTAVVGGAAFGGATVIGERIGRPALPAPGTVMPGGMPVGAVPGMVGMGGGRVAMVDGCCPTGYHPEKSGKPYCVRNRRMNIANPRALRRSMRRVQGFEKLAKRTISFTRRVKMKKGRTS